MEDKKIVDGSMKTLRRFMFEEMIALREGNTTATDAIAMSKLAHQVIESYKTEIEAVKTADSLKDRNINYISSLKAIES